MSITEIGGFKVVPVKFKASSSAQHWLYIKEHAVREKCPEKPADKTLFVIGVPPYCTEDALQRAFSKCGKIKKVYLQAKPSSSAPPVDTSKFFPKHSIIKGFKVAYIVFESVTGLQAALGLDSLEPLILSSESAYVEVGIRKWSREYNERIPQVSALQAEVDSFMELYDKKEAAQREAEGQEVDDEGWVTVTKRGRNPGFARKESVEKRILGKERKKRAKKQLLNFYRFQIKESKMNQLMELREKFEEDKKKIALLKQTRKFKPF
ncbi:ribosomal RNA-processing protein 7 homolog A [Homalodisca vitripennis]|uniref:ribosomal RNA-processing protein 7 homolog A n=1 Tax=Homalodisca vitripennis TaxID=197043 RepID=UPI001EE9E273|nr:ribosomal RNA-processing protein 7 homolog A [Homalodisca vitripennis]KAG8331735.1 Ribosomal RNA-processing protein 7 A [Homalodisca vitripennis]